MDYSLKVPVVLQSLQEMALVCKEPAVLVTDGSEGAWPGADGMTMAC